jgi:hypothetical protein
MTQKSSAKDLVLGDRTMQKKEKQAIGGFTEAELLQLVAWRFLRILMDPTKEQTENV